MSESKESSPATVFVRPFVSVFAEVTDFRRQPQYSLPTLLSIILLGLLSGQNTIRRIAA